MEELTRCKPCGVTRASTASDIVHRDSEPSLWPANSLPSLRRAAPVARLFIADRHVAGGRSPQTMRGSTTNTDQLISKQRNASSAAASHPDVENSGLPNAESPP